jgi:geranylgeranyl diphosphate synthase type II
MNFEEELKIRTEFCEEVVKNYLPELTEEEQQAESDDPETEELVDVMLQDRQKYASRVIEAMNYSVESGGKRLRPMLMLETFSMYEPVDTDVLGPFMAAIEMIHTYSLVHDDLPEMDNDEFRRGRRTTHTVYGQGMAVLAGDGLLNYAYETIAALLSDTEEGEMRSRMIDAFFVLSSNAGIDGMVGGQCADLLAEGRKEAIGEEELIYIHTHKTACMLESALMIGAILAGAPEEDVQDFCQIGEDIGLAFQIRDDILDVEGNAEEIGKATHQDDKDNKSTYVTLFGLEKAKDDVRSLTDEALDLLDGIPVQNDESVFLHALIESLAGRNK